MDAPLPHAPHVSFQKLLHVLDDLRRRSIKLADSPDVKKVNGLTVRQGTALSQVRLLTEENPQGISLKSLAASLQMTVPATSLLVEAMVSKGFFERSTNPTDRRAVCIRLSAKGHELFESVYSHFYRAVDRLALHLEEDELRVLDTVAEKLRLAHAGSARGLCLH